MGINIHAIPRPFALDLRLIPLGKWGLSRYAELNDTLGGGAFAEMWFSTVLEESDEYRHSVEQRS
jgi:hypothetical protein